MKLIEIYKQMLNESTNGRFIAYHGTDHDITKFSDSFIDGERVTQHHGSGIYFATNYENARMFGKNVYKVELIGSFISEDTPTSKVDKNKLIQLMKLSDEDEWELEAQNYHPDPKIGLKIALDDALNQENEAAAFMRIQSGGWYMQNGIGYVRAMTKIGIDGVIVTPPEQWVGEKHIIVFNPNAIKFIKKMDMNENIIKEGFDEKIMFKQNIELMIDTLPDGDRLKKYYEWLYYKTNMVNVIPLTDSGININSLKASENDCFVNSILIASKIKGSKFVFGFAVYKTGEVASHGWIKIGNRYHDPTYEKFHTIDGVTYLKLGELEPSKAKYLKIFKAGPQANFANDAIFMEDFENGAL